MGRAGRPRKGLGRKEGRRMEEKMSKRGRGRKGIVMENRDK